MSPTSYRAAPPRDNIIHIVYMVEDDGIEPPTPACKAGALPAELILQSGDPYGIRTRVTAVKGRCLNHLTNGPNIINPMAEQGFEPLIR